MNGSPGSLMAPELPLKGMRKVGNQRSRAPPARQTTSLSAAHFTSQ